MTFCYIGSINEVNQCNEDEECNQITPESLLGVCTAKTRPKLKKRYCKLKYYCLWIVKQVFCTGWLICVSYIAIIQRHYIINLIIVFQLRYVKPRPIVISSRNCAVVFTNLSRAKVARCAPTIRRPLKIAFFEITYNITLKLKILRDFQRFLIVGYM